MESKSAKDILSDVLSEGTLLENGALTSAPMTSDRYTPTTVTIAPPLQNNDGSVSMQQVDGKIPNKPDTLLYPFETIFDTLYSMYIDLDNTLGLYKHAKDYPTTSQAQKASLSNGYKRLVKMQSDLEVTIKEIGSMHV